MVLSPNFMPVASMLRVICLGVLISLLYEPGFHIYWLLMYNLKSLFCRLQVMMPRSNHQEVLLRDTNLWFRTLGTGVRGLPLSSARSLHLEGHVWLQLRSMRSMFSWMRLPLTWIMLHQLMCVLSQSIISSVILRTSTNMALHILPMNLQNSCEIFPHL